MKIGRPKFIILAVLLQLLPLSAVSADQSQLFNHYANKAIVFDSNKDLKPLVNTAAKQQLVLLGESTHGTQEFYDVRVSITKDLIKNHGFKFIAVEAPWNFMLKINDYIKGYSNKYSSAKEVLKSFDNWPEWMWKNQPVEELVEWIKDFNKNQPEYNKVGFYGLDLYEPDTAIDRVLTFVGQHFPVYYSTFKEKLLCFTNQEQDSWSDQVESRDFSCSKNIENAVKLLLRLIDYQPYTGFDKFNAWQNALVIRNAERFYRWNDYNQTVSWNVRSMHMWQSVLRLIRLYGKNTKAIIWAHNTHIGNVEATPSSYSPGSITMGYLAKKMQKQVPVFLLGFSTDDGEVLAANAWGENRQIMDLPNAQHDSFENVLSKFDADKFYFVFNQKNKGYPAQSLITKHRAIGVVYNPKDESKNYMPVVIDYRYDGLVFIKNTSALRVIN